jgi:hypothetical protein
MFCCKGKRLANFLLEHGCRLIRIDCDQKSKGFLVFLFEENENLKSSLIDWDTEKLSYLV